MSYQLQKSITNFQNSNMVVRFFLRAGLINSINTINDPKAVKPLISALGVTDEKVRLSAISALIRIGQFAVEDLISVLKNGHIDKSFIGYKDIMSNIYRMEAASAFILGEIGDHRAIEALIDKLLTNETFPVTARALAKFSTYAVDPLIAKLAKKIEPVQEVLVLGMIGDDRAIEPISKFIKESGTRFREYIAWALGRIGNDQAVEILNSGWVSEYSSIQEQAIRGLSEAGTPSAVKALVNMLTQPSFEFKDMIAVTLGKIGDPRAFEPLIDVLQHSVDVAYARDAAVLLGKIGDSRAVEPLITALNHSDKQVQEAAALALGKIGDKRAADELLNIMLQNKEILIRNAATIAFGQHDSTWLQPLLKGFPHLLCSKCYQRTFKRRVHLGFLQWKTMVFCHGCNNMADLLTGVREVVGVIGASNQDLSQDGGIVRVNLWNEAEKKASNADIDRLVIEPQQLGDLAFAVDSVINTLKSDKSHTRRWLKKIPVTIPDNPPLSDGIMTILTDNFGSTKTSKTGFS